MFIVLAAIGESYECNTESKQGNDHYYRPNINCIDEVMLPMIDGHTQVQEFSITEDDVLENFKYFPRSVAIPQRQRKRKHVKRNNGAIPAKIDQNRIGCMQNGVTMYETDVQQEQIYTQR